MKLNIQTLLHVALAALIIADLAFHGITELVPGPDNARLACAAPPIGYAIAAQTPAN